MRTPRPGLRVLASLVAVVAPPAVAAAAPLSAVFSGTGSGFLGALAFSEAPFRLEARGDTRGATVLERLPGDLVWVLEVDAASIAVEGLPEAIFPEGSLWLFNNPTEGEDLSVLGIGAVGGSDLLDLNCVGAACATWALDSAFDPGSLVPVVPGGAPLATDLGTLDLDVRSDVIFEAVIVPEPSTAALLAAGLVGLAVRRRSAAR